MSEIPAGALCTVATYRLRLGANLIEMPAGSRLLGAGSAVGCGVVWALVMLPADVMVERRIMVVRTDQEFVAEASMEYVGTFHPGHGERMIFHVFDCGEE